MKILVVVRHSPVRRFLVDIDTNELVKEVTALLKNKQNSKAIMTVLAKGMFEKEVYDDEIHTNKADMILTEESAHWDLMKK